MKRLNLARSCALFCLCGIEVTAFAQAIQNTTNQFEYDANGNLTKITDPRGQVTTRQYDALNRIIGQTRPAPFASAPNPTIGLTYDGRDQISSVTDPRKLMTTYVTDGLGNQSALSSPDTGSKILTYDLGGNVKSSKDARSLITTYAYDALNRLAAITYASGTPSVFVYDGGTSGAPDAIGHLTKITDEAGTTAFSWNGFGQVLDKTQAVSASGTSFTLSRLYGDSGTDTGKVNQLTYPSGNLISYVYDATGRISELWLTPTDPSGTGTGIATLPLMTEITYQPFGAVQSWNWGNSSATSVNTYARGIDLDGRVTGFPLGSGLNNGLVRSLAYDPAGRIVALSHSGAGSGSGAPANFNQSLGYDNADRLIAVTGATSQSFQYDASGNRIAATFGNTNYANTVSPTSNRLTRTTGPLPAKTNQYDAAGNLTSDGSLNYLFDARGRLSKVTVAGGVVSYQYNALGQRLVKMGPAALVPSGMQQYVYDDAGHLMGEYDSKGNVVQETVWLGNLPVAVLKQTATGTGASAVTDTQIYYVYADQINTPRVITQASDNQIVWRWDAADPFGLAQPNENPSGVGGFIYNPRFPGQLYDRETNLHYNYFRDYDPQLGRYVESDPIGLAGGVNTY